MRRGLTLIEVLMAIGVLGIVAAAVFGAWVNGERTYREADRLSDAQARARVAMRQIEREVRSGSRVSLATEKLADDELDFRTIKPNEVNLVPVRYFRNPDNQLIREEGGAAAIVASDVSSFGVVAATGDTITIEIRVTVGERSAGLQTLVAFRNP
jgi:prepilin-type N-terminal cleavage/methylation domain-containing protein